ncbi:MAG: helix-turn-helix domain-containing protein [Desulfonatronovibrionaceae bacterium]
MELSDIGHELRAERERQGISLDKVHEDTRIGLDFLESLEAGNSERLSHPVYAKGFVQNYARYLGLDWKKIGDAFARIYSAEDQFEKIDPEDLPTSLKYTDRGGNLHGIVKWLVIITALIIILASGWYVYTSFDFFGQDDVQEKNQESSSSLDDPGAGWPDESAEDEDFLQQPADISEEEIPDHITKHREDSQDADQPHESAGLKNGEVPEVLNLKAVETPAAEESAPSAAETVDPTAEMELESQEPSQQQEEAPAEQNQESREDQTSPSADQGASETAMSLLEIQAREDCWLMAMIDGSSREVYLRAGEDVSFEFKDVVRLTLGNAGGIDVFLNDQPFPIDAESGEVRTLDITAP